MVWGVLVWFGLGACHQTMQTHPHEISCSVRARRWVMNERCVQSKNQSPATRVLVKEPWSQLLLVSFSNVAGALKGSFRQQQPHFRLFGSIPLGLLSSRLKSIPSSLNIPACKSCPRASQSITGSFQEEGEMHSDHKGESNLCYLIVS